MTKNDSFHILALSGGGFKGLYSSTVLAGLEKQWNTLIGKKFDLICGTSIGGIIALAIALEIPADEICRLFKKYGKKIFPPKFPWQIGIFRPKHNNKGLKFVLNELFGEKCIKDLKHRVLIPSINYSKGSGQFFKTQHYKDFKVDGNKKLVDVALATSAAPIFFPMHATDDGAFVDGGLIGNAPGFFGMHEATHFLKVPKENIRLLSVGTLSKKLTSKTNQNTNMGILGWREKVLLLAISSQEASTDFLLRHYLNDKYTQIDEDLTDEQAKGISLDAVNVAAIKTLEQNANISIQKFLGKADSDHFFSHDAKVPMFFENGKPIINKMEA